MRILLDTCVWGGARKDRLVNLSARQQGLICLRIMDIYGDELQSGAIVTAEPGRLRIHPPDQNQR